MNANPHFGTSTVQYTLAENVGRKWKDLQQEDDGRETVENWRGLDC